MGRFSLGRGGGPATTTPAGAADHSWTTACRPTPMSEVGHQPTMPRRTASRQATRPATRRGCAPDARSPCPCQPSLGRPPRSLLWGRPNQHLPRPKRNRLRTMDGDMLQRQDPPGGAVHSRRGAPPGNCDIDQPARLRQTGGRTTAPLEPRHLELLPTLRGEKKQKQTKTKKREEKRKKEKYITKKRE